MRGESLPYREARNTKKTGRKRRVSHDNVKNQRREEPTFDFTLMALRSKRKYHLGIY